MSSSITTLMYPNVDWEVITFCDDHNNTDHPPCLLTRPTNNNIPSLGCMGLDCSRCAFSTGTFKSLGGLELDIQLTPYKEAGGTDWKGRVIDTQLIARNLYD